jgi:general secretion pathway protein D
MNLMIAMRRICVSVTLLGLGLVALTEDAAAQQRPGAQQPSPRPRRGRPSIDGKGAPEAGPAGAAGAPGLAGPAGAGGLGDFGAGAGGGGALGGDPLPGERAATDCVKLNPSKRYKWDLRGEIDLAAIIAWAQSAFCQTIIVPTNLRQQKITIYAPATMSPQEMYRMFLAALNAMGLTVQPQGAQNGRPAALVVIETSRARESAIPTLGPNERTPNNDAYVTKMIRLDHIGTEDVLPIINRLKSQAGDVIAAPPSTLIITDGADNIRRVEEVIGLLDIPLGGERIWTVKLQNVGATEMATLLQQIFQPKGGGGGGGGAARPRVNLASGVPGQPPQPVGGGGDQAGGPGVDLSVSQIIPEDRTNTLIIVATDRAFQRILGLINRLDQAGGPLDTASGRVHVYFLANANAEDMATTLSSIGVSATRGGGGSSGGRGGPGGRPGGAPALPPGVPGAPGGQGAGGLFEGDVRVASDKATNSLIIVASGKDYITIRDLIRTLDIARRQVFIEAVILEVSLDKSRRLGLSFHGGTTSNIGGGDQSLIFGGVQPGGVTSGAANSIFFSPAALSGLAAGLRGPAIPNAGTILGLPAGQTIPSFGVFLQLLQNNNDVNIISMPHILTSDNEKATIQVGRNLPFPASLGGFPGFGGATPGQAPGATQLPGVGFGLGTSVQRQDVALKMEVTPHVNDSDFVRLEVDNEISDVASENFNGLGPATDKRTVKTVVVVRDQQSVVLGGLQRDRVAEAVDKVPLLGDIPLLGYLFKRKVKSIVKQNLLIILTPYVIKDPLDLRNIFERKVRERREFLERFSPFRDPNDYEGHVEYRRRRGLLQEINVIATEAEREAQELQAAEANRKERIIEGPVEPAPLPRQRPQTGPASPRSGSGAGPGAAPAPGPNPPPPSPENNFGGTRPPTGGAGAPGPGNNFGGTRPPTAIPSEPPPESGPDQR